MTARVADCNGWYEVRRNPLSRVGVFPYRGSSVGLTGADADRIVRVYRPAEELASPECLDSFRLLPWVDEHAMMGPDDAGNVMPAEAKGVQGVIGEDIVFDDGVLYGNIKVFSNSMASLIEAGKRQLSAGYRCVYDFTPGVFDGLAYDAVQRKIRGNHLALVGEGRMGPTVAVQDSMTFTFDAQEATPMADPNDKTPPGGGANPPPQGAQPNPTPNPPAGGAQPPAQPAQPNPAAKLTVAEITAVLGTLSPLLQELKKALGELNAGDPATPDPAAPKPGDPTNTDPNNPHPNLSPQGTKLNPEDENAMDEAIKQQVTGLTATVDKLAASVASMDAAIKALPTAATIGAETAARDKLADRLGAVVGTFDAKDKTLLQVAEYGVEKLELKDAPKGGEVAFVSAFLSGIERNASATTVRVPAAGMDAAPTVGADNFVSRQLAASAK